MDPDTGPESGVSARRVVEQPGRHAGAGEYAFVRLPEYVTADVTLAAHTMVPPHALNPACRQVILGAPAVPDRICSASTPATTVAPTPLSGLWKLRPRRGICPPVPPEVVAVPGVSCGGRSRVRVLVVPGERAVVVQPLRDASPDGDGPRAAAPGGRDILVGAVARG